MTGQSGERGDRSVGRERSQVSREGEVMSPPVVAPTLFSTSRRHYRSRSFNFCNDLFLCVRSIAAGSDKAIQVYRFGKKT